MQMSAIPMIYIGFAFKMQNITRKMTNKKLPNAAVPL